MNIFRVNNRRGALCLSQGRRMGYPAWWCSTCIETQQTEYKYQSVGRNRRICNTNVKHTDWQHLSDRPGLGHLKIWEAIAIIIGLHNKGEKTAMKQSYLKGKFSVHTSSSTWICYRGIIPDSKDHGPTWGPSGADRTRVGPMLAPWTLLSGIILMGYGLAKSHGVNGFGHHWFRLRFVVYLASNHCMYLHTWQLVIDKILKNA